MIIMKLKEHAPIRSGLSYLDGGLERGEET
jgi:hypothetical protein